MGISASGVGSGLDIEGLVTQLMAAERAPLDRRLLKREANITSDISALGSLKGALSSLQASLPAANSLATYEGRNATSSNASALGVGATSKAALGSYSVSIEELAAAQSLAVRNTFTSPSSVVGEGTLTFTFGTTGYTADASNPVNNLNDSYDSFVAKAGVASKTVSIGSGDSTLSGVRDAINQAKIGVSAAIVNDGNGYRLIISSDSSGAENSLAITVADSGDSNNTDTNGLSRLAFNSSVGTTNVYQTVSASDAAFTVNGLALTSEENTVTDALEGLTLSLNEKTTKPETISVIDNTGGIKSAINTFVEGYSSFVTTLDELTGYDDSSGVGGALQGDFTARSIKNQIRSALSAKARGYEGTFTRLASLGITTAASGALEVDDAKLSAALKDNFQDVAGVMTRVASVPQGSGLSGVTFSNTVAEGAYTVGISSLATSGKVSATIASAGFPKTVNSASDGLYLTVDGTASGVITLSSQAYGNLTALASEMESKINADATLRAAGKSVTVTVNGDDIEVRSGSLGSTSTVLIANAGSDSTLATIGFASPTITSGTNLVGTIGGVVGVAEGNVLTGAANSGTSGLSVEVSSTAGGEITVSDGVIDQLDSILTTLLNTDGSLDSRITTLQASVDDIVDDRADLEIRMQAIEARYRRRFNSLDTLLSEISGSGSLVANQLANIPIPGKTKS